MTKILNKNRELKRTKLKAISKIAVFMFLFLFIYILCMVITNFISDFFIL